MDVTTSFENYCQVIKDFSTCMNDYLYVFDMENDAYCISEKAVERFMVPSTYFHDVIRTHGEFVYSEDVRLLKKDLEKMVSGEKDEHNIDYRWIGRDGEPIWINCRGRIVKENGKPRYLVGCVNEIGQTQRADNNSGLLTSSTIKTVLDGFFKNCPNGFILRLGIEDFSEINEKLGIEYGDYILKNVAKCIQRCMAPGQEVYRTSNSDFLVCDYIGGNQEAVLELFEKIRREVVKFIESIAYKAAFTIAGGVLQRTTSEAVSYSDIMKLSQFALLQAMKVGKNQCYFFSKEEYEEFLEKRRILTELSKSVAKGFRGFSLCYQPIVQEDSGAGLFAAEALLRFKDSEGVMIPPYVFIPILEESGLIIPVGKFVLREAAQTCKEFRRTVPNFRVSINLSYVQIMKSTVLDEIFSEIERFELEPDSLIIELTESGYFEASPAVQKAWEDLKEYGVMIAIDDFGTGYSNLQSISRMSPNIVKVDREFTARALKQEFEKNLMASIVNLVHGMNLRICVEGIETEKELSKIRLLNPDYIQGYYFGKPCDKKMFMETYISVKDDMNSAQRLVSGS